jgi:hypothetical protein
VVGTYLVLVLFQWIRASRSIVVDDDAFASGLALREAVTRSGRVGKGDSMKGPVRHVRDARKTAKTP